MTLSTRSELITDIGNYMHRDDLTGIIPTFIRMVEANLNKHLRVAQMMTQATLTLTPGTDTEALPSDFLEARSLILQGAADNNLVLNYQTPRVLEMRSNSTQTGKPDNYTIIGEDLKFAPSPDSAYDVELEYFAEIPALTSGNTTNWLLTDAPDIYLYGCLLQGAAYVRDRNILDTWRTAYYDSVRMLKRQYKIARSSGSGLSQRAV